MLQMLPPQSGSGPIGPDDGSRPLVKDGRPLRVLIIEDDALVAMELGERIEENGGVVAGTGATAREAVRLAMEQQPDCILMDVRLRGGVDGITAAETIRATPGLTATPIIFVTGNSDPPTLARMVAIARSEILIKPVSHFQLIGALSRAGH